MFENKNEECVSKRKCDGSFQILNIYINQTDLKYNKINIISIISNKTWAQYQIDISIWENIIKSEFRFLWSRKLGSR